MVPRAAGLVGKALKRTPNMHVQASTSPRRGSHIPQQLCLLHSRPAQPKILLQEQQHLLQNNIRENANGSFDQRFSTLKNIGEDRVSEREIKLVLKKKPAPICYVWCDPSPLDAHLSVFHGSIHVLQGITKTLNINEMVKSGFKVKILMADWFAQMNSEIGGNLNKVRTIGRYNIEMWKATGMALDEVELVWLSDEISRHGDEYWPLVMDIARKSSVRRIRRCRGSRDPFATGELTVAETFYPCLQSASILFQKACFFNNADIWLLGVDQHDANLLTIRYCRHVKRKSKPVAVLHNTCINRRHPGWAIFMEDEKEEICFKIEEAYCPPKLAEGNPCLEYIKYIILPWFQKFEVVRKKENGGKKTFVSMEELRADYESGALHPADVKLALVKSLNKILQPVRNHFRGSTEAKNLAKAIREYYVAD
ncbi:hypothetical protein BS78_04G257000 [Paspalum vaginatum]|nr:hypothetical protein BS78_04G257000 [Paspalum vaginatum]